MNKIELVTLGNLARIMEKPVMEVLEVAKKGNAIWTKPEDSNIYINLEMFNKEMDKQINEEMKAINKK